MTHVVSPFYVPLPVSVSEIDKRGRHGEFSQIRDLRVAEPYRVAGSPFEGTTIDANFWVSTVSGAGAANTQANGALTTASGTANSGYAQMQSVRRGRFIFAHPMIMRFAVRIPTIVVALNTRRWGAYTVTAAPTPTDGFWFELSAAGVLSVVCGNAGTPSSIASGSFNGELGASYTLDTNIHAFEIHYFVMEVQFYIDGRLLHTFTPTTTNLSSIFTLPITWASVNGGAGVTSGPIEIWATNLVRIGREATAPTSYYFANGQTTGVVLKRGPGMVHGVSIGQATNNAVIQLYDALTNGGTPFVTWVVPNNAIIPVNMMGLDLPFYSALTLEVKTQNAGVTVIYE